MNNIQIENGISSNKAIIDKAKSCIKRFYDSHTVDQHISARLEDEILVLKFAVIFNKEEDSTEITARFKNFETAPEYSIHCFYNDTTNTWHRVNLFKMNSSWCEPAHEPMPISIKEKNEHAHTESDNDFGFSVAARKDSFTEADQHILDSIQSLRSVESIRIDELEFENEELKKKLAKTTNHKNLYKFGLAAAAAAFIFKRINK